MQYIDKSALVAELNRKKIPFKRDVENGYYPTYLCAIMDFEDFINTLEVKDPYEQSIQYASIESGIQANAETYSFNIESELFNQLTKEQQTLWHKEIEQAYINGGNVGVELARDPRYKENLEVKEVDLEKEIAKYLGNDWKKNTPIEVQSDMIGYAKHFFELGMAVSNPTTAADKGTAEEIIINLKRVEQDYRIDLTKEIEWLRNKVKKGEE